jgi:signal transduction histidine kinase
MGQGKPLLLNNPTSEIQAYHRNPNLKTLLAVPLNVDGLILGALDVVNKPGGFTNEDIQVLQLFADQAAVAIEHAQLYQQAEKLVVLEERQRLARELHDSVTQSIYSINLYAEATRMALSAGKTGVAAENLRELRSLAREALLDMRMLIFELHQPTWEEEGLANALQSRLEAVEARSGLQTEFHVKGEMRLSTSAEEELYRIAQEALTNAVKHAKAQKLIVRLNAEPNLFYLEVQDDGLGFDLAESRQSGGLGLQSIEERVLKVNGKLTIESPIGKGTTLRVEVKTDGRIATK